MTLAAYGRNTMSNPITIAAIKRQQEKERERGAQEQQKTRLMKIRKEISERKAMEAASSRETAKRLLLPKQRALADVEALARVYGVTLNDILGKARTHNVVPARQAACWMLWFSRGYTLPEVGRLLGLDHTSALYSIGKHLSRIGSDHKYAGIIARRQKVNADRTKRHYREMVAQERAFSQAA